MANINEYEKAYREAIEKAKTNLKMDLLYELKTRSLDGYLVTYAGKNGRVQVDNLGGLPCVMFYPQLKNGAISKKGSRVYNLDFVKKVESQNDDVSTLFNSWY